MARAKVLQLDSGGRMTAQKLEFLEHYVENGGNAKAAWLEAGFAESTCKQAMQIVRQHWQDVEILIRKRVGSHVPMALAGVVELAKNAKQDSVRLKALQDILSRAGYDKPQELVVTEKKAEELDNTELEEELLRLLKERDDG